MMNLKPLTLLYVRGDGGQESTSSVFIEDRARVLCAAYLQHMNPLQAHRRGLLIIIWICNGLRCNGVDECLNKGAFGLF